MFALQYANVSALWVVLVYCTLFADRVLAVEPGDDPAVAEILVLRNQAESEGSVMLPFDLAAAVDTLAKVVHIVDTLHVAVLVAVVVAAAAAEEHEGGIPQDDNLVQQ